MGGVRLFFFQNGAAALSNWTRSIDIDLNEWNIACIHVHLLSRYRFGHEKCFFFPIFLFRPRLSSFPRFSFCLNFCMHTCSFIKSLSVRPWEMFLFPNFSLSSSSLLFSSFFFLFEFFLLFLCYGSRCGGSSSRKTFNLSPFTLLRGIVFKTTAIIAVHLIVQGHHGGPIFPWSTIHFPPEE